MPKLISSHTADQRCPSASSLLWSTHLLHQPAQLGGGDPLLLALVAPGRGEVTSFVRQACDPRGLRQHRVADADSDRASCCEGCSCDGSSGGSVKRAAAQKVPCPTPSPATAPATKATVATAVTAAKQRTLMALAREAGTQRGQQRCSARPSLQCLQARPQPAAYAAPASVGSSTRVGAPFLPRTFCVTRRPPCPTRWPCVPAESAPKASTCAARPGCAHPRALWWAIHRCRCAALCCHGFPGSGADQARVLRTTGQDITL